MIEQNVSENLDEYILNYSSQLMNVNIQSLSNIFRNPNKKFTEYNKAYNAIRQHFLLTNDDSIFILLQEIDGSKLNLLNLEDSILSASNRFGFMPNKNLFCEISNLIETNKKQEEINQKMNDQIELINKEFSSYKEKNEEKFQKQERKYEEQIQLMNNELNIYIEQLDSIKKEFDSYKNEKEIAFQLQEKKINEQFQLIQKMNNEFNLFVKKNDEIYQKQKEINDKQRITNEKQIKNIDGIIEKQQSLR